MKLNDDIMTLTKEGLTLLLNLGVSCPGTIDERIEKEKAVILNSFHPEDARKIAAFLKSAIDLAVSYGRCSTLYNREKEIIAYERDIRSILNSTLPDFELDITQTSSIYAIVQFAFEASRADRLATLNPTQKISQRDTAQQEYFRNNLFQVI